jgi:hypothetical protein
MRTPLRSVLPLAILVNAVPAYLHADEASALEGIYLAQRVNEDGRDSRGFVQIIRHGQSYLVRWIFQRETGEMAPDDPDAIGIGIRQDGLLAVGYYGEDLAGIVVYTIEEGGRRLVGRWTAAGGDGVVRSETLTRVPASPTRSTRE